MKWIRSSSSIALPLVFLTRHLDFNTVVAEDTTPEFSRQRILLSSSSSQLSNDDPRRLRPRKRGKKNKGATSSLPTTLSSFAPTILPSSVPSIAPTILPTLSPTIEPTSTKTNPVFTRAPVADDGGRIPTATPRRTEYPSYSTSVVHESPNWIATLRPTERGYPTLDTTVTEAPGFVYYFPSSEPSLSSGRNLPSVSDFPSDEPSRSLPVTDSPTYHIHGPEFIAPRTESPTEESPALTEAPGWVL